MQNICKHSCKHTTSVQMFTYILKLKRSVATLFTRKHGVNVYTLKVWNTCVFSLSCFQKNDIFGASKKCKHCPFFWRFVDMSEDLFVDVMIIYKFCSFTSLHINKKRQPNTLRLPFFSKFYTIILSRLFWKTIDFFVQFFKLFLEL